MVGVDGILGIVMNDWPGLWAMLRELAVEPDQRILAALKMCPIDRSIHDFHVLGALFRLNSVLVRHPYAEDLLGALRSMQDPGEYTSPRGESLGGTVVPSLLASFRIASRSQMLTTSSFLSGWARNALKDGGSQSRRSFLIKYLMDDADTPEASIYDVPELDAFLIALVALPQSADDIEYVVALEGERIVFRPVSVVNDYVQQADSGRLVPQRSLLTHFRDKFGLFTIDQIEELEELINDVTAGEEEFQTFFERNPHFLRQGNYREVHPHPYLCHRDEGTLVPDFILTDQQLAKAAIVELKLPRPQLIRRQSNRERFSAAVFEARVQLLRYRDWFRNRENRRSLRRVVGMEIYEPRLAVIIGRSSEFEDAFDRQRLAADTSDIEVVTYDDIVTYARQRRMWLRP